MNITQKPALLVVRCEDLWFSDGSMVLQADNTQYKVFHSILSLRSPIFRDMLSIPQGADLERVEGCPLVRLPDAERDVTPFLKAIYTPLSFPSYPNDVDVQTLLGCFALSHKYEVEDLRRRALAHIAQGIDLQPPEFTPKGCKWSEEADWMHIVRFARVARTTGDLWVLPWVFLCLSRGLDRELRVDELLQGVGEQGEVLPLSELPTLLGGRDLLKNADLEAAMAAFSTAPGRIDGCTGYVCLEMRLTLLKKLSESVREEELSSWVTVRAALTILREDQALGDELCARCCKVLLDAQEARLTKMWQDVPGFFGLPDWPELDAMREQAVGPNIYC
ncbi:BTB domain-containing protein [Mycena kentingensis (nom. inval.)]|nr:BTB domain-containing protein [Mycena kentingensis (nom. inval.)]